MKRLESRLKELEKTAPPNAGPPREQTPEEKAFFEQHRELIEKCNSGRASIAEQCDLVGVLANKSARPDTKH